MKYLSFIAIIFSCHLASEAKKLFIISGANHYESVAEVLDLEQKTWRRVANWSMPRVFLNAVGLNGLVYVVGRHHERNDAHHAYTWATFDVFDPAENVWFPVARNTSTLRLHMSVAALGRKIYAVGGRTDYGEKLKTVEAFDTRSYTWTSVRSMHTKRSSFGVAAVGDFLYAVGGVGSDSSALKSAEVYDPKTDRWRYIPPMEVGRDALCVAVLDGKLYAIGGMQLSSVEVYDPQFQKWTRAADMLTPRGHCGAAAMDGLIYVLGGFHGEQTIEVYDPKANSWDFLRVNATSVKYDPGVVAIEDSSSGLSMSPLSYLTILLCGISLSYML